MKKGFILTMLVLVLTGAGANARTTVKVALKAEANMSNYFLKDMPGVKSNMHVGATLGGALNINFGRYFALRPELLFHYRGAEMKLRSQLPRLEVKTDYEYWGGEIPVYAVGQLPVGTNGKLYLGLGPYVGLGFSLKNTTDDINLYKEDYMQRFDFGGGALLGYEFRFGLQINAQYKMGFLNLVDNGSGKMRQQTVSLGVAYRF
jgi:hypothetical protein